MLNPSEYTIQIARLKAELVAERVAHQKTRDQLQETHHELDLLNQVGQIFNATLDLDQVLLTVLEAMRNLMAVSACSIWLVDPQSRELVCRQATGIKSDVVRGWRLAPDEGISGWVARHGQSVIVPDTLHDQRHFEGINQQIEENKIRSILSIPLKIKQRVIGVLEVVDTEVDRFTERHLARLEPLTASVTIFIENARLYEQARQSQEQFRQFVTSISDHIYVTEVTAEGRHHNRYISPNVEALTGYAWQKFKDDWRSWSSDVIHPEDRALAAKQAEKLVAGQDSHVEYRLVRADGRIVWVRDSGRVETEGDSKIIYGLVGDITDRKQREQELETIVAIATALRTATTRDEIMSVVLDHTLTSLGMTGTALGIYYPNRPRLIIEAGRGVWANLSGAYITTDEENEYIFATDHLYVNNDVQNDPHLQWANLLGQVKGIALVPLMAQARSIGILWVGRQDDISAELLPLLVTIGNMAAHALHEARLVEELRRSNEELAQERASLTRRVEERTAELRIANAELARAARLKDEFLANMSHELRTPLTAVLSMSELLRTNVYGPLNEEQRQALNHIEEGGRHLLDLINDILDLSKIEAGKLELRRGPVDVETVCQVSLRFIKQMAQQKGVKVLTEIDDKVEIIEADERRLKQILVNLLNNAVKFTPDGGQVGLRVAGDEPEEIVRFTIWDTGIGIAEADMKHLFEPFVQIDSSLSREYEGTGLGLSLAARLTELHEGSISLDSQVGQGTRLTISLPWQREETAPPPNSRQATLLAPGHPIPTSASTKILLVEDNETTIITLRDYLHRERGYRVFVARDGAEAVAMAEVERPDLILMDVQLPVMNGLEATQRLRSDRHPRLAETPIIALTALAMPGDRERCLAAGANEYLSKPISLHRLGLLIERQLQRPLRQS